MALICVIKQKMTNKYDSAPVLDPLFPSLSLGSFTQNQNHNYMSIKAHSQYFF